MRFNEHELIHLSQRPGTYEGRLAHRAPTPSSRAALAVAGGGERWRERWFKIIHNLLFYYRLNEHGGVSTNGEPAGLIIMENCSVQIEPPATCGGRYFCLSITLDNDSSRRHLISCQSAAALDLWSAALTAASYSSLRQQLKMLRARVLALSGVDPLKSHPGQRTLKNLSSVDESDSQSAISSSFVSSAKVQRSAPPVPPERTKRKQATFQSHLVTAKAPEYSSLLD